VEDKKKDEKKQKRGRRRRRRSELRILSVNMLSSVLRTLCYMLVSLGRNWWGCLMAYGVNSTVHG
jgi:hypothetical protein